MRGLTFFAASLTLLAAMAGCSGDDSGNGTTTPPPPPSTAPYTLECSIATMGGNWTDTCLALASPNDSDSKTEVDLVVNPTNPLNVFVASKDRDRLASDCVWAVGQYSMDGGMSWNTTYIGGQTSERMPGDLLYGWECITDPIMTFNKDGDLFYALQTYSYNPLGTPTIPLPVGGQVPPEAGQQLLAISRDGGATFDDILVMHGGDGFVVFHDYMHMGTNPVTGTVFTIWNQLMGLAASVPVIVAYDPGLPAARPPIHFSAPPEAVSLGESGVVGMADGTVIAWLGGFNSPDAAFFATSTDDGQSFSTVRKAFDFTPMGNLEGVQFRYGTVVELASDNTDGPHGGCLHAVWGGQESGAEGASDIYARSSCDKGTTWSEPVLVNGETRVGGQWMPRVTVDGHGTVHVVYYSQHYHAGHTFIDAEHAYSMDGGRNWTTQRLTTTSFDGDLGIHQNDFPFIGDYIGIGSAGGDVYMGFPTTATGRAEIAVAHVVANESSDEHAEHMA